MFQGLPMSSDYGGVSLTRPWRPQNTRARLSAAQVPTILYMASQAERHKNQMELFHIWRPCPGKIWENAVSSRKSIWNRQTEPIYRCTGAEIGVVWNRGQLKESSAEGGEYRGIQTIREK